MQRITTKDLESLLARINEASGYGPNPKYPTGYHLGGAYGGHRMEYPAQDKNERGFHKPLDTLNTGYVSKRELHTAMAAFLRGLTIKGE